MPVIAQQRRRVSASCEGTFQPCRLSLLLLFVFKLQPQRKTLEEHVELVLDSERLKGLSGKTLLPLTSDVLGALK